MVRPITDEDLGLRVLYDGTDSTPHPEAGGPVDIVAVHGMGAHPDDTWCKKVDGHDGPAYVNWLKDERFLPAIVPRARIMRYGYSSQWFGKDAIKTKTSDISQAFLLDLDELREEDQNRPLILIGHSFGGLVILKMMVDAHLERKRWPGIYDSTVGLVFLGTPFRGTHDSLSQGEILTGAYELFGGTPIHGENLGILRAGGEPLTDLVDQYLRIVRQGPMPRVACFFEQRPSEVGRILGKDLGKAIQSVILVNETSGSLDLNEKSDKYASARTHFDIHTFRNPDEQAFRQVRRVIRKMVEEGPQLVSVRAESASSRDPPCHNIPFPRNEALVERSGILSELERLLPSQTKSQSAALWGLGGSGKTQMALEYAYRRWHSAPCSVFWVHADNETTFAQDYQSIAKKLGVPTDSTGEELLAAVRGRIEAEPSWVLILDNADNIGLFGAGRRAPGGQPHRATDHAPNLHEFVPRGPTGTVLWTSRDEGIAGSLVVAQRTINVARMEADEAVRLLEATRNKAIDDTERDDASALLAELDWLPLAISQAAAYMRRTRTPIKEYLSKLTRGKRRWRILRESEPDVHRRRAVSNSILETWSISIEHIRQENQMAYNTLHVLAFLDNQRIPWEMVRKAAKLSDNRQANGQSSDSEDEDAIDAAARLREFSFLSLHTSDGGRAYEMHKLVQEATRYGLRAKGDEAYFAKAALRVVDDLFPQRRRELWGEGEKYLVHAQRVGEWAELCGEEEAAALLIRVSDYLYDRGRWREREPVDERAYGLRKKVFGDKHPGTIRSMAELATTYHGQGRYDEAEKISVEVLALQRDLLGDKHPNTIRNMEDLAATYNALGRYDEAEKICLEVLALQRDVLGDKHLNTIWSMASLATTYNALGRYDEAEKICLEVLALRRDVLGDKHPDTIQSMAELAATYHNQGRYDEAEKIKVEVLALRRDVLGDKHPDTIQSMASLAATYHNRKRYDEAEKMNVKVLALRRDVLGNKHPDTIWSMAELAAAYHTLGRYDEAEKISVEVLALRRDVLGDKHPDTIRSMYDLAITWNSLRRHDEALAMMDDCVQLQRRVLGPNHPHTQDSLRVLNSWK